MSGLPRSNRTRLKLSLEPSSHSTEGGILPHTSPPVDVTLPHPSEPLQTSEHRTTPPLRIFNGSAGAMDIQQMNDEVDDIQEDGDSPAVVHTMPSTNLAALSDDDDDSSVLSEVDDGASYNDENLVEGGNRASSHESDSEAETERLDPSPQKFRERPTTAGQDATINKSPVAPLSLVGLQNIGMGKSNEDDKTMEDGAALERLYSRSPENRYSNGRIFSPPDIAGHKRKRSGSIVGDAIMNLENEPLAKRSASVRLEDSYIELGKGGGTSDAGVADDEGSDALSDVSSASDLTAVPGEMSIYTNGALIERSSPTKDIASPSSDEDIMSDQEMAELPQDEAPTLSMIKPEDEVEADEVEEIEVDEEEAEIAAKSEDEIAKKKSAVDALVPIEKLFAIFRDRLFDQKLAELSAEMDQLNDPNSTHPEYLAMKQCIDERREQKIQLENVSLFYKQKNVENTIIAARAQLHSQYFQAVRAIREKQTENLNFLFCKTQKERRQIQAREPEYGYVFNPKRSKQIIQQTAYNKEVSLLAGIARYVGFPSAPELHGARGSEMEDDFRAMQIKPPGLPKPNFATLSATSRVSDAAAEEHFFEKNPWAANPQLHAAQSMLIDRASPRIPLTISTPIALSRNVSATNSAANAWMTPDVHPSMHPTPTDTQPHIGTAAYRAGGAVANGTSSSPFEPHIPRRNNTAASTTTDRNTSQPPITATTTATTPIATPSAPPPPPTSAPTATPITTTAAGTTRFERPYKPKNIPPPNASIYTPSPRSAASSAAAGFMRITNTPGGVSSAGVGELPASAKAKEDASAPAHPPPPPPSYGRIGGFTAVNGGAAGLGAGAASTKDGVVGAGAERTGNVNVNRGLGIGVEGFGGR